MTAIPQSSARSLGVVSDRLSAPLRQVSQRHWLVLAAVGVCQTLITGLVALLLAALLLGFFQHMWMPARFAIAVIAWMVVVGGAVVCLRPALRRWNLSRAAMQVEHLQPNLHERISSAVELSGEKDATFRGSQALVDHLVRQAEADAAAVKPEQIIRADRVVRWAMLLVPVLVAWMLLALLPATTKTAMAGLYRVFMPWRDSLPTVLTQVDVNPKGVTVVQGDPLDITARVTFDASSTANTAHAIVIRQFENGQKLSQDMDKAGAGDYRIHFDDLQQTFNYMVQTDQGDSSWYKATVHPRPSITALDIKYEFPAYTGLPTRMDSDKDGTIEALVGTRVTLTVHTALPIVAEKSHVVLDQGTPEQLILPLKQAEPGKADYQATLVVNHSGEYKINLTNEFDLTNKDEQPRSIVADPDEVPTIVIRAPEPQITVRPDDTVPVKYLANDDFGVSKIEAILQIDDHEPQTVPVKFKADDKRNVTGPSYRLAVADVLKSQNLENADHITYQLKVTDNRDPDPQFSFSTKQTLKINKNESQSYQAKTEQKIAQDLRQAIQKAINELNQEQQHVQSAKDHGPNDVLDEWSRKVLHQATEELPKTSSELSKAADEAMNTVFQDVAVTVKEVAEKPIRAAAEDAAQADLNVDSGQERQASAIKTVAEITDARTTLEKLLEKQAIEKDQRGAEAARDLAEAARKQQEAADLMKPKDAAQQAAQPDAQPQQDQQAQARQKQQEANQKLHQAIDQAQALQDPKARETAQKLAELIRKVEDVEKQQQANAEQTEKQEAATQIQEKANELAKQQEALNKDIEKAADQHKQALQQANANPPPKDQQNNIVKQLDQNQLQQAHDAMKNAANQLNQEAQQLQNQAKSDDLKVNPQQQDALNKDQQAQQNAQNEQNQANQAAQALNDQARQNEVPKADNAAVKSAQQAAQDVARQAADAAKQADQQVATAKQAAQAAQDLAKADQQAADQAKQDAQAAPADQGAQQQAQAAAQAAQAAQQDAQAAQKAADQAEKGQEEAKAAAQDAAAAQQDAQQAAAAANPQDAQKDLKQAADALQKAGKELAQATQQNTDAAKAEMVAAQKEEAHQAADQAGQEARQQEALAKQLEGEQQQLAQVQQNQQPADQAAQQQAQIAEQTKAAEQQAKDLQQQAKQADNANVAHRAEMAQADLADAQQHAADAAKDEQQAAQAQQQAAAAPDADHAKAAEQAADAAQQHAADQQQAAQDALAKAENALRDLPQELAKADADAGAEAPHEGEHQGEAGEHHEAGAPHQGTPEQSAQQAAQGAQEAAQAQQEASQDNAAAAQEAANALAQSAQAMANAVPGSLNPGDPEDGNEPGQEPSEKASTHAGQNPDSKQGIASADGAPIELPASVRDIGITSDQWAKLPDLARKDLMNAAQQSGPPTYRQMIKDYYVRIAKMQDMGRGR